MKFEVSSLLFEHLRGLVGQVLSALDGFFEGEVEAGFSGQGVKDLEPALRGFSQRLQSLAEVCFAIAVLIEVGAELVHQRGEILQFIVEADDARGRNGLSVMSPLMVSMRSSTNLV